MKGDAAVAAASVLELILGDPLNLHWCADLGRVEDASAVVSPEWDALLDRLQAGLDAQEAQARAENSHTALAITILHHPPGTSRLVSTFFVRATVSLRFLLRGEPPMGRWRLWTGRRPLGRAVSGGERWCDGAF